jgi:hypothetical protein
VFVFVCGATRGQAQPARPVFFTPSLGVAVPVGAFSEQNPTGLAIRLGLDLPVTDGNHLGVHYEMQRYGLDAGVTEWIVGVSLHDKLFLGKSGFFIEAGFGLYIDERTGNQAVVPLRHTQWGVAATPAAQDNLATGIDAGLGWRLPGRNMTLVTGYHALFDQRVESREGLGRTQYFVFELQTALQLP